MFNVRFEAKNSDSWGNAKFSTYPFPLEDELPVSLPKTNTVSGRAGRKLIMKQNDLEDDKFVMLVSGKLKSDP